MTTFPLSTPQRRIWYTEAERPGTSLNHLAIRRQMPDGATFQAIEAAWNTLVERHDTLRLQLVKTAEYDDFPVSQRVVEPVRQPLITHQVANREEYEAMACEIIGRPFDLKAGGPLWRAVAFQVGSEAPEVLLVCHHLISDGWSLVMMGDHLARLVGGDKLPPVIGEYRAFVDAERAYLESPQAADDQQFWRGQLADPPKPIVLSSLTAGLAGEPFAKTLRLSDEVCALSLAAAREMRLTLFKQVLAALTIVVARSARVERFGLGVASHNRTRRQFFTMGGMFVGTLPLVQEYKPDLTFAQLAHQMGDELDALLREHSRYPFDLVVSTLRKEGKEVAHLTSLSLIGHPDYSPETTPESAGGVVSGLAIHVNLGGQARRGQLVLGVAGDGRTVGLADAERLVAQIATVLEAGLRNPEARVATLPLISNEEQNRLLGFNGGFHAYPESSNIVGLWNRSVRENPAKLALVAGTERLTYEDLDSWSDGFAAALRQARVRFAQGEAVTQSREVLMAGRGELAQGPSSEGGLIGVCLGRGATMAAALLGVLKSGAGYVPLDPEYPPERLRFMLEDAGIKLVVAERGLAHLLPDVLIIDPADVPRSGAKSDQPLRPEGLAYVIYTSGTTGKPKGVPIAHHQVLNLWQGFAPRFGMDRDMRALLFASINFDASVVELFLPLLCGATVIMALEDQRRDGPALLRLLEEETVTWATIPPALLAVMPRRSLPHLAHLGVAGESSDPEVVDWWSRGRTMYNAYGPTECTVAATIAPFTLDTSTFDIGSPIPNTHAYVLDGGRQMVPVGVAGELYLAGVSVSKGYLGHPDLTAERFLPNPWATPELRNPVMYKTGDLVRWTEKGRLEFIGRVDFQVKIRGHRIECGEVGSAISELPEVSSCLVVAVPQGSTHRLVAYLTAVGGDRALCSEGLRSALAGKLPDYMVPSAFVVLDAFPLTPNGKIDRKALPVTTADSQRTGVSVTPRDALETNLHRIWADLLGAGDFGVEDDFFALGGDSLSCMKLVARAEEAGLAFSSAEVRERPTISGLADLLRSRQGSRGLLPPLRQVEGSGPFPLSQNALMMQQEDERMAAAGSAVWPILAVWEMAGALDPSALRQAVHLLIAQNDALRVRIQPAGPETMLLPVSDGLTPEWETVLPDQAGPLSTAWREEPEGDGPSCRIRLWRLEADRHWLVFRGPHQLLDGWSSGRFMQSLAQSYQHFAQLGDVALPEAPTSLRSFTHWYHDLLSSPALEEARDYWRRLAHLGTRVFPQPPVANDGGELPYSPLLVARPCSVELLRSFEESCRKDGATLFEGGFTAFLWAVAESATQDRLVVGYVSALRDTAALQTVPGSLTNRLFLSLEVPRSISFGDLLHQVQDSLRENDRHHLWPAWREFGEDGLGANGLFFHLVPRTTEGAPMLAPEVAILASGPPPLVSWPLGLAFQLVDDESSPLLLCLGRRGFCDEAFIDDVIDKFLAVINRRAQYFA